MIYWVMMIGSLVGTFVIAESPAFEGLWHTAPVYAGMVAGDCICAALMLMFLFFLGACIGYGSAKHEGGRGAGK